MFTMFYIIITAKDRCRDFLKSPRMVKKKGFNLDGNMPGMYKLVLSILGEDPLFTRIIKVYSKEDNHQ